MITVSDFYVEWNYVNHDGLAHDSRSDMGYRVSSQVQFCIISSSFGVNTFRLFKFYNSSPFININVKYNLFDVGSYSLRMSR